jgi:beta-carotene 3-hydroxylase
MNLSELIVFYAAIVFVVFLSMEFVAWFMHKYIMHGFGWFLHEDHHRYTKAKIEKNDIFGVFFSGVSFLLIFTGWLGGYDVRFPIGIGVMMYGIGYFIVHDTFFHHRVKLKYRPKSDYIKRVLNAHAVHHQKSKAHEGVCFGFLYASKKYAVKKEKGGS